MKSLRDFSRNQRLLSTGTNVTLVGTGVCLVVLLFVLSSSNTVATPRVEVQYLPLCASVPELEPIAAVDLLLGHDMVDFLGHPADEVVIPSRGAWRDFAACASSVRGERVRLHLQLTVPWASVRELLVQLRSAGQTHVRVAVRTSEGVVAELDYAIPVELPCFATGATAQDFVDSISNPG